MARENFKDIQVTVDGETKTLQQWAADLGINYMTVCARYRMANEVVSYYVRLTQQPPNQQTCEDYLVTMCLVCSWSVRRKWACSL